MRFGLFSRAAAPVGLRPATAEDADACAAVHAVAFERPWDRFEFERLLCEPNVFCEVAVRRSLVVGFVMARGAADEAEILSIGVDPARRRAGIGRQLLARMLAELPLAGVRRLFLEVDAGNAAAIGLYRSFGFAEVGRRQSYYRRADGSAATALVMRLDLS